jgi:hypothetical protein
MVWTRSHLHMARTSAGAQVLHLVVQTGTGFHDKAIWRLDAVILYELHRLRHREVSFVRPPLLETIICEDGRCLMIRQAIDSGLLAAR